MPKKKQKKKKIKFASSGWNAIAKDMKYIKILCFFFFLFSPFKIWGQIDSILSWNGSKQKKMGVRIKVRNLNTGVLLKRDRIEWNDSLPSFNLMMNSSSNPNNNKQHRLVSCSFMMMDSTSHHQFCVVVVCDAARRRWRPSRQHSGYYHNKKLNVSDV